MKSHISKSLAAGALLLGLGGIASADVPMQLAHQGRLFDSYGTPVEGSVDVTYALYTSATGGTSVWSEHENVEAVDGFFSSVLGDGTTLSTDIFMGAPVYLSVKINGEELLPRTQLVSVPYALVANDAVGDIHPRSVTIGSTEVIDENGKWVGDPTGLVGPQGPKGADGAMGPQGPAGADGAMGPIGPVGETGATGPMGPMGPMGPAGADGATGPQGPRGFACWDSNENGACDVADEDRDASGTCEVADCVGAQGPVGPTGATGAVGPQGATGPQGAVGETGPQGPAGPVGPIGPEGPIGPTGPQGLQGPAGPAGATGATGATGPQGPMGPAGPGGGGVTLKDASNVTLGTVLGIGQSIGGSGYTPAHTAYVVIKTSTGHIVPLGMDGLVVFGQMYFDGGNCNAGSGIMNSGINTASRKNFCKLVMRSSGGGLYTTGATGCDANGLVDSVPFSATNIESTGSCSPSTSHNYGWPITPTTNTAVGLPATIALPLSF